MKKNILAFVLLICIAFTSNAQKHQRKHQQHQKPEFTVEQHTTLAVKKMTLALDLTESQQEKMHPLLLVVSTNKQKMKDKRKENEGKRPEISSDELYAKMIVKLDKKIAFQEKVKKILTKDQYQQWRKMHAHKKNKNKSKGSNQKKGKHNRKK